MFLKEFENAQKTEDFNEEWEKVLYRICYKRPRLKPRVSDISKFLSYIKDDIFLENPENIGMILSNVLTQTSVTSVSSTDQGQEIELPVREKGSFKRVWFNDLESMKKSLDNLGFKKDLIEFTENIYSDVTEFFPNDIEIKFLEDSFVVYVAKHRIFKVRPTQKRNQSGISIFGILKDFDKDYKIPSTNDLILKHQEYLKDETSHLQLVIQKVFQ